MKKLHLGLIWLLCERSRNDVIGSEICSKPAGRTLNGSDFWTDLPKPQDIAEDQLPLEADQQPAEAEVQISGLLGL